MPTQYHDLIAQMEAVGIVIDRQLRWDGKIVRLRLQGKKDRSCWVVGKTINGKQYATFGDWSGQFPNQKWTNDGINQVVCSEQWREQQLLAEQRRIYEQEISQKTAAKIATQMWNEAIPAEPGEHLYLIKKQVQPHGLRVLRDELLVPYYDEQGKISTVQRIWPDGRKQLHKNGRIQGCCHIIPPTDNNNTNYANAIYICEGWATGATINELTGCKVLVVYSCGNIKAVAESWRKNHPGSHVIIAADNDHRTKENPGLKAAQEAAGAINASVVIPEGEGTDFNDMVVSGHSGRATEILTGRRHTSSFGEIMSEKYKQIRWIVNGIIPEGLTILAGRPKFGKSWLMLGLAFAVSKGELAWNYGKTQKADVLYLALEDSERRIQDRGAIMYPELAKEEFPRNLFIETNIPATLNNGFIEWLQNELDYNPNIGLVIVDTLQKIRPAGNGKQNLYQVEYEDFGKLQKLAITRGVGIIGVHHTRKRSTKGEIINPMDEISGSSGIQGVADTIVVCMRNDEHGEMFVTGREVNECRYPLTMNKLYMQWEMSAPNDQIIDTGSMLLINWFQTHETITAKELAIMCKIPIRTARHKLKTMADEGRLVSGGEKKPNPTTYKPANIFLNT